MLGRGKIVAHVHCRSQVGNVDMTTLTVLKRFEFQSQLLPVRSGVLAVDSAGPSDEALLCIQGAPACI